MGSAAHFIFITGLLLLWPQGPDAGSLLPQIEIWLHGLRLGWAGGQGRSLPGGEHWHFSSLICSVSSPFTFSWVFAFSERQQLLSQNPPIHILVQKGGGGGSGSYNRLPPAHLHLLPPSINTFANSTLPFWPWHHTCWLMDNVSNSICSPVLSGQHNSLACNKLRWARLHTLFCYWRVFRNRRCPNWLAMSLFTLDELLFLWLGQTVCSPRWGWVAAVHLAEVLSVFKDSLSFLPSMRCMLINDQVNVW